MMHERGWNNLYIMNEKKCFVKEFTEHFLRENGENNADF